jgi:hypothetical protein
VRPRWHAPQAAAFVVDAVPQGAQPLHVGRLLERYDAVATPHQRQPFERFDRHRADRKAGEIAVELAQQHRIVFEGGIGKRVVEAAQAGGQTDHARRLRGIGRR